VACSARKIPVQHSITLHPHWSVANGGIDCQTCGV